MSETFSSVSSRIKVHLGLLRVELGQSFNPCTLGEVQVMIPLWAE